MNQYQRMVSYLYEYKQGVKGVNVGYVRIEQRGSGCRISLQMRSRNLGQLSDVAVFRQGREGIRYYTIGTLTERNGDYRCRIETESGNLMESGINISDVDGIILYQDDTYYVATTWKNQSVRVGENRIWDPAEPEEETEPESVESETMESEEKTDDGQMALEQSDIDGNVLLSRENEVQKDGQDNFGGKEVRQGILQLSGDNGYRKNDVQEDIGDGGHLMEEHRGLEREQPLMRENQDRNTEQPFMGGNRERNAEQPFMGENRNRNEELSFMRGNQDRNTEQPFMGGNGERNAEQPFMGENRNRDAEQSFMRGNRDQNEEQSLMGENRDQNEEQSLMGENRDRNGEQLLMGENRNRNAEQPFMGENRDRNGEQSLMRENRNQNEERQVSAENREEKSSTAYSGQNGMTAMGQRFPRWGGMPFFRRRPMGNANIPIPQMGEWSNGNRQKAESAETNPGDQSENAMNLTDQEPQISGASQERKEKIEEETVCRNCPFKRKSIDYGKRILMTFPVMRPFPNDQQHACVRIEPQDLGCLPMQMWTLANNQFLLQGYYCYRHLIFMETEEQGYVLGVPGVYDRRTCRQAERFGFSRFRAICGGKQCEGAFGYWLMPLSQM